MRTFLRALLVGFLSLWLPLQSAAAVGMAFCGHGQPVQEHHAAVEVPGHDCCDHAMHGDKTQPQPEQQPAHGQVPCDHCTLCALCAFSAIPAGTAVVGSGSVSFLPPFLTARFSSFVPERPQRPPLTARI